jgi:hypothetical protein
MARKKSTSKTSQPRQGSQRNVSPLPVVETAPIQSAVASSNSGLTLIVWLVAILVVGGVFFKDKISCTPAKKYVPVSLLSELSASSLRGGPFNFTSICALGKDRVAIADENHTKVLVLGLNGDLKKVFGEKGKERNQLHHIIGICSDPDENIYVLDHELADIFGFHSNGKLFLQVDSRVTGYYYGPRGVCYIKGNFAIADTGSARVVIVDPSGKAIYKSQSRGSKSDQFVTPNAVLVDAKGRCFISDSDNKRIKIQDEKGNVQKIIQLQDRPVAIALDESNHLFVSFANALFVQEYRADSGSYIGDLTVTNPSKNGSYRNVSALCVVDGNKLVAADSNNMWVYQLPI